MRVNTSSRRVPLRVNTSRCGVSPVRAMVFTRSGADTRCMATTTATRSRVRPVNREAWLQAAVTALRPTFRAAGLDLPPVRVSVGWPGGRRRVAKGKVVLGQCWSPKAAKDGRAQVFVSPVVDRAPEALAVLVHELCHAVDRNEHGHDREFALIATALGLVGKPTETVPRS